VVVPDYLSVIGYDGIQLARWLKPALTTLRERRFGEAQAAGALLLDLINGAEPPAEPLLIQTDLVVRQSTGPAT
jgi:DNA-binding LacI/PurR family transcriptional regulator